MLTINKNILEYTCDISHILERLFMDSSYQNGDDANKIICEDKRCFVVNRLEKSLYNVVDVFGDAYTPSSLYIDNDGVCGFFASVQDRVISDMPHALEPLDVLITDYIISYINRDWHELLGTKLDVKIEVDKLWQSVNRLFLYKSAKSYVVEEV